MLMRFARTDTSGSTSAGNRIRFTRAPDATITPEAWASEDENQSHGRSPEKRKTAYPSIGTRR